MSMYFLANTMSFFNGENNLKTKKYLRFVQGKSAGNTATYRNYAVLDEPLHGRSHNPLRLKKKSSKT
jgi:hypothetical protein